MTRQDIDQTLMREAIKTYNMSADYLYKYNKNIKGNLNGNNTKFNS